MTIPVQPTFTASIANGVTTVFPYGFKIAAEEDLAVTIDGVIQTSGYTVSGVGNPAGGNVTFAVAPANLKKVVSYLAPVMKRDTDYQQFGDWLADVVNLDFDRIWLALQTLKQNDIRSLKLPIDTTTDQALTQDAAARANKTIKFDASGNLTISNYDPDDVQTAAAISAAAALASKIEADADVVLTHADVASAHADALAAAAAAATITPVGTQIHAAISDIEFQDTDEWCFWDSTLGALLKITGANIKATLKNYFDTLYTSLATVIATANIWSKGQSGAVVALTDGANIAVNLALANNFSVTLGGNRTLDNPTNIAVGQSGIIAVTQDGTGSRTLAYGSYYKFPGGTVPTLTTTAAAVDDLAYYVETSTRVLVNAVKDVK